MFTGIVAGTAPIVEIGGDDSVRTFSVDLNGFDNDLERGASVSLDGVCMTVVNLDNGIVSFDAISSIPLKFTHRFRYAFFTKHS